MLTIKNKKKKIIDLAEEEKLKALLQKPVDTNTLSNDKLRPWTVNPSSEGLLRNELVKLDKTIVITSPQMTAGDRGSSILDRKLPEIEDFRNSFKMRTKLNPYKSIYEDYILQYHSQFQPKVRNSGNGQSKRVAGGGSGSGEQSRTSSGQSQTQSKNFENDATIPGKANGGPSPSSSSRSQIEGNEITVNYSATNDDQYSEVDTEHVTRIQKMIQAQTVSAQHLVDVPLPTVQYRPFKSPAVFPVSTTEYQKLKHERKSFPRPETAAPPPIHLNHRNQMLMLSIVSNHDHHENDWYYQPRQNPKKSLHRSRSYRGTKLNPDIKSSYYHVPPPGSS